MLSSTVTNNGTLLMLCQDFTGPTHSYAGNIVGSGKLVMDASTGGAQGTLTLTGDSTHTGGTIIQQGRLVIGDGNVGGSLAGKCDFYQ